MTNLSIYVWHKICAKFYILKSVLPQKLNVCLLDTWNAEAYKFNFKHMKLEYKPTKRDEYMHLSLLIRLF